MYKSLTIPFNPDSSDVASVFDEAPLWSVPFGLHILDHVVLKEKSNILDIGCGAGFPLLEVAQRAGSGTKVYGIDPWHEGLERLKYKASVMKVKNLKLYETKAEKLPFKSNFFDVIISNNGLNNVENPAMVLSECFRTAKQNAQLLFTANLPGSMRVFYDCLEEIFINAHIGEISKIHKHISHKRKTVKENTMLIKDAGFSVNKIYKDSFKYRFSSGTAFLNHYFIRIAFMENWENLIPEEKRGLVFTLLETSLNQIAKRDNGLTMDIPFACSDCFKP